MQDVGQVEHLAVHEQVGGGDEHADLVAGESPGLGRCRRLAGDGQVEGGCAHAAAPSVTATSAAR